MEKLPNEVLPDVDDDDDIDDSSDDGNQYVNTNNIHTKDEELLGDMNLTEEDKIRRRKSTNMLKSSKAIQMRS